MMDYEYQPAEWNRLRCVPDTRYLQIPELIRQVQAIVDELKAEDAPGISGSHLPTYLHWCAEDAKKLQEAL